MTLSKRQINILFLLIISFILAIFVFNSIEFLVKNKYIVECFQQMNEENNNTSTSCTKCFQKIKNQINQINGKNNNTSKNVNLPLNTTTSCKNFCSPTGRCAITGEQCLADIDCFGCQPKTASSSKTSDSVPGDDDAGKLTVGTTPNYSTLTNDIGTRATTFTRKKNSKPISPDFGVNTWINKFNEEDKMFEKRYTPTDLQYMMSYPDRYSLTGDFVEDGPLASNANLN